MTLLGRLDEPDTRFPFQGTGINGRLELADELESPERIVTCVECTTSLPESRAFRTRHGTYVCKKAICLSEYSEADANY